MKHRFFYNKRHVFVSRSPSSGNPRLASFEGDLMGGVLTFFVDDKEVGSLKKNGSLNLPEEGIISAILSGSPADPESDIRVDILVDVSDA